MIEQNIEEQIIDLKNRIAQLDEIEQKFLADCFDGRMSEWDKNNCINAIGRTERKMRKHLKELVLQQAGLV